MEVGHKAVPPSELLLLFLLSLLSTLPGLLAVAPSSSDEPLLSCNTSGGNASVGLLNK